MKSCDFESGTLETPEAQCRSLPVTDAASLTQCLICWKHAEVDELLKILYPCLAGQLPPLTDLVNSVKEAFKLKVNPDPNKVVKDLKEVYNKLKDLSDKAATFADVINPANFQADQVVRGCLFDSSPGCNALLYEGGFTSVFKCPSGTFCPPAPVLLFVWNHADGGLAVESPVFFPKGS